MKSALFLAAISCILNSNDPFEPSGIMPAGPLKGHCIGTEDRRTLKILSSADVKLYPAFQHLDQQRYEFVANLKHQGKYWIAAIPTSLKEKAVEKVIFQIEHFPAPVPAAHTQVRYHLKPEHPALLYPQALNEKADHFVKIYDLITSFEAVPARDGPTYDLFKGQEDYFALAYRIITLEDKIKYMITDQGHQVDQLQLNLDAEGSTTLLHGMIQYAGRDPEMNTMYQTLGRNCTSEIFQGIDASLGRVGMNDWQILKDPVAANYPPISGKALRVRGLLNEQSKIQSLNDELGLPARK